MCIMTWGPEIFKWFTWSHRFIGDEAVTGIQDLTCPSRIHSILSICLPLESCYFGILVTFFFFNWNVLPNLPKNDPRTVIKINCREQYGLHNVLFRFSFISIKHPPKWPNFLQVYCTKEFFQLDRRTFIHSWWKYGLLK